MGCKSLNGITLVLVLSVIGNMVSCFYCNAHGPIQNGCRLSPQTLRSARWHTFVRPL